jgi:hypothetical protein
MARVLNIAEIFGRRRRRRRWGKRRRWRSGVSALRIYQVE